MQEADGKSAGQPESRAQPQDYTRQLLPRPAFMPPTQVSEQSREQRVAPLQCDGQQPSCAPCLTTKVDCQYISRGSALNKRFNALQESYGHLKSGMELLCSGTERDAINVLKLLRTGQAHENILSLLYHRPDPSRRASLLSEQPCPWTTDYLQRAADEYTPQRPSSHTSPIQSLPLSRWTALSDNDFVLTHLFKLFWTWDTTPSRIIHRGILIEAICAPRSSEENTSDQFLSHFCSEALINAILAYAVDSFSLIDSGSAMLKGRDFAREATRLLNLQPQVKTIAFFQATAILSVYEHAFGNPHKRVISGPLIDPQTVQMLLQEQIMPTDAQRRAKVQEALLFIQTGLYQLNVLLATRYSAPSLSSQGTVDKLWIPYPDSSKPRISYAYEAIQVEYELAHLAVECLVAAEANQATAMPDRLGAVNIYSRLFKWNQQYGERTQGSSSSIPSWVAIIVFYNLTCLVLLEPFISLPFLKFHNGQSASTLSQIHSEAIILALVDYEVDFAVRHDFWLSYTCGVAVKHLLLNTTAAGPYGRSLSRGCELLYNTGRFTPQANKILLDLSSLAEQKGIILCARVRRLFDGAIARITPIKICNASCIVLTGDNLMMRPVKNLVFNQVIQRIER
ncbi:hypothetical protein E4U55_002715 [Claviceps digitariae]|nr:hypothetical protein E4U55_002715 [Claviceps digitariae]